MSYIQGIRTVAESGISRRQVLKSAGTGFGYLALAGMLGQNAVQRLTTRETNAPSAARWRLSGPFHN